MVTFHERYPGDTLEQYLMDTECGSYEGDGAGMAKHLKDAHNVDPLYTRVGSQSAWSAVADQHVEAHKRELEAVENPNGLGYAWNFNDEPESFASRLAISMMSGDGREPIFDAFMPTRSESQPAIVMRVTLNGVEVDANAILETLKRNFEFLVSRGVEDKLRELNFEKLGELVYDMDKRLAQECRERMQAAGLEVRDEEEWR